MLEVVKRTFVLTGALKGRTIRSGQWKFINGLCRWKGLAQDEPKATRFLKRMWQVEVIDGWIFDPETPEEGVQRDSANAPDGPSTNKTPAKREADVETPSRDPRTVSASEDRPRPSNKAKVSDGKKKPASRSESLPEEA